MSRSLHDACGAGIHGVTRGLFAARSSTIRSHGTTDFILHVGTRLHMEIDLAPPAFFVRPKGPFPATANLTPSIARSDGQ